MRILLLLLSSFCLASSIQAQPLRDRPFDDGWQFHRGHAPGAEDPGFDDATWRTLHLPHDWSIEDLPPKESATPELDVVSGEWRFHEGDNFAWRETALDDQDWRKVTLPAAWEEHSDYNGENVYGWYRRKLQVPAEYHGRPLELLLGRIDDVDEVWVNGKRIGGSGSFPPEYRTAWDVERRYRVPASLLRGDGTDVIAVRVFDGENSGGMVTAGTVSERIGPFDPQLSQGADKTGYVVGGTGWYRKHFTLDDAGKRVAIRFDGVYMNADVWINGHHLGLHPYGYTGFEYDLTPYLRPVGEANVLAVRVRNEGKNSRWYSGSGIYRHVWLTVTDSVHIPTDGMFVSTPEVSKDTATVKVLVEVRNVTETQQAVQLEVKLLDPTGRSVGSRVGRLDLPADEMNATELSINVANPRLWSPDSPQLYLAQVQVVQQGHKLDRVAQRFGIRSIEIDATNGFRLNGQPMLLKGGCIHHDNGPLGAAAIDRAEERKVELLKANGYNALRTSHNPPSPALLDACDRLGVLVIDEVFDQWNEQKLDNSEDYHRYFQDWHERDVAAMVRRDRNHPSVIMWSVGNEIPEQFRAEETQLKLCEAVLAHDDTRPVTQAICTDWGKVIENWDELSDPAFTYLDVAGYNYLPEKCELDHARHPDRVMYGSESFPKDALLYWKLAEDQPYVIGDFVWTAMDYLGESGLAHAVHSDQPNPFFMSWHWHNAWCGDLDICGFKKPQSYYRDVVWRESPIELAVHAPMPEGVTEVLSWWAWPDEVRSWNWSGHEGRPLQVAVYSRCDAVRLELNGRVIGEQPVSEATKLTAHFEVPYEPGELRAIGIVDGKQVASTVLKTTGPAERIKLTVDRSSIAAKHDDLSYVTVEVVDNAGQRVPDAAVPIRFTVSGVGSLAGQANGAPDQPASFQAPARTTFRGRCLAILRSDGREGEITLEATADGLEPASLIVECEE